MKCVFQHLKKLYYWCQNILSFTRG